MSESLGSAVLDLTTDASGLEEGLSEAEGTTESWGKRTSATIAKGAKIAGAAMVAVGAAAVTGAFKTAKHGDELDKTSSKLGVHTDFLQDAQHWANQNGLAQQSMERAVGRLNQRIGRAAAGNEKYAKAFEHVGVSIHDAQGEIRDTEDVMRDTIDALQGIEDPAARSAAASEIFGTKMARDLMPALEDGSLSLAEATAAMDEHGRMTEDQIAQAADFSDSWDNIKTAGMSMLRQGMMPVMGFLSNRVFPFIQERVIPALQRLADWLGPQLQAAASAISDAFETHVMPILQRLGAWWEEHGPTIVAWGQRIADMVRENIVPILGALAALLAAALVPAVGALIGALGALFSPVALVIAVIAALGFAITKLWQESETFRTVVTTVWNAVKQVITTVVETLRSIIERFVAVVSAAWERWGDTIMTHVRTVWGAIQRIIGGVLDVIRGVWNTFAGIFTGDWSRAWDGIKSIFQGVWNIIRGIFEAVISQIRTILTIALDGIRTMWSSTWNGIVDFVRQIPGRIVSALGNLARLLFNAGKAILRGLVDGIKSMASAPLDAVKNVVQGVRNFLPFSPAKEGPLATDPPDEAGRKIVEMLGEGIASATVSGQMSHLMGGLNTTAAGSGRGDVFLDGELVGQVLVDRLADRGVRVGA